MDILLIDFLLSFVENCFVEDYGEQAFGKSQCDLDVRNEEFGRSPNTFDENV